MMCMTELHGGVCHRTSAPHKSGSKMKEKKEVCKEDTWVCYGNESFTQAERSAIADLVLLPYLNSCCSRN